MPRPALRFAPTVEGGCHFFPRRWPSTFLFDHAGVFAFAHCSNFKACRLDRDDIAE